MMAPPADHGGIAVLRTFRVWAPNATTVDLVTGGGSHRMEARPGGWFVTSIEAPPGMGYRFALDGREPRPDPRSPWQPHGVDGPSRTIDHSAYEWKDGLWRGAALSGAVIYELHIGTFTSEGTFLAAIDKLDRLVDLGVTAVELMPVAEFSGRNGWGYDGVDLFAPHHAYGEPDDLKRLIDACHARGLAVVMDVVYNHLGPSGNYLREFGPYFTDRYATPWGEAVNFDGPDSDEVRRFFVDNALMWLRDYHCDGLRLDAVHAILDGSATHILEQISIEVKELEGQLGRTLWLIAESDLNDPRVVQRREAGGYGMDAQWSDDFHHCLHALLTGERKGYYQDFGTLSHLAKSLAQAFVYDGIYAEFRRRSHGRKPVGLSGHRFLGYLQDHDQVGNRAVGERSSALMSRELLKVGAALVLCSPFVPMLFQGEEWGASTPFLYFTDHPDPELGRAVSEGRRREFAAFGWSPEQIPDPQDPSTFQRSRLDWSEPDDPAHADLLDWHRRLIRLRRETPALSDGRMDLVRTNYDEEERWIVIHRGPITIACNLSGSDATAPIENRSRGRLLLTSGKEPEVDGGRVRLPAESVTIWSEASA